MKSTVEVCESCHQLQPSQQQEPYRCDDHPKWPFESVSADFFQVAGKSFLVITDRLSGWPVVVPCSWDTTSARAIQMFCSYFQEVGVPLRLRTDSGPPFSSNDFKQFAECWGVQHIITKPSKHLIIKMAPTGNLECEKIDRGLLELHNNHTPAGHAPAQVLYGRTLHTCVLAHP